MPSGVGTGTICGNERWSETFQGAGTDSRQGRGTDLAAGGLRQGDANTHKGAGYRDIGKGTVSTAGIQGMGDTIRESTSGGGTGAAIRSDAADERAPFGGPVQPGEEGAYAAGTKERTQESEGCGYGGGMGHEVQSRIGSSAECSRGRMPESAADVGTEESGGTGDDDSDRRAIGENDKNRESSAEGPSAGSKPTDPDGDGRCPETD